MRPMSREDEKYNIEIEIANTLESDLSKCFISVTNNLNRKNIH